MVPLTNVMPIFVRRPTKMKYWQESEYLHLISKYLLSSSAECPALKANNIYVWSYRPGTRKNITASCSISWKLIRCSETDLVGALTLKPLIEHPDLNCWETVVARSVAVGSISYQQCGNNLSARQSYHAQPKQNRSGARGCYIKKKEVH